MTKSTGTSSPLKIAINGPWISLHPGLQHTAWADLVLSNQFEALVGINNSGTVSPLGAKSWRVSADFTNFVFDLDTTKRFSDGSRLLAKDYKQSWENALRLEPKSANSSLLDVVGMIEGYEKFSESGELSGVRIVDDSTLSVSFKRPFRMALNHFSGNRFSAYKERSGKFFGTGRFVIEERADGSLLLIPNSYFRSEDEDGQQRIRLSTVAPSKLEGAFFDGSIDVLAYGLGFALPPSVLKNDLLQVVPGPESVHVAAYVNGKKRSIFSDQKLRLAFQYLLHDIIARGRLNYGDARLFTLDPQVYLPLQPGRLEDASANKIVASGQPYLADLFSIANKRPLVIYFNSSSAWIRGELEKAGLVLSNESRVLEPKEAINFIYKSEAYDAIFGAFSVAHGDPDGIYHVLGPQGAIVCPVAYREGVGHLLEEGRSILGQQNLNEHYKKVSEQILKDVPFVHIGFSKSATIYRKDRVSMRPTALVRNEGHLNIFRSK